MIKLACSIPNKVTLACSGGSDSMVVLDFLLKGRKDVTVAYFNHGTVHGDQAENYLVDYCEQKNLELVIGKIKGEKKSSESPEEFWRNQRLSWLHGFKSQVVTGHHLDDAVEWWIFSSLNGCGRLIPLANKNIIRPFLLTPKSEILDWAKRKEVSYVDDPSNDHLKYARNRIRHNIMPEVLKINPGIRTVVRKKIEDRIKMERGATRPVC